jgi:CHAT domain-containing protein
VHPSTARILNNIALLHAAMGQYARALPLYQRALAILEQAYGWEHPATGVGLNNLGSLYEKTGQYQQALPLFQRALAISEKAEGPLHPSTARNLNNLAFVYEAMGQPEQALPLYQQSISIYDLHGASPRERAGAADNIAVLYIAQGERELGIYWGKRGVNTLQSMRSEMAGLDREQRGSFDRQVSGNYQRLAGWLIDAGRLAEAEQVLALLKDQELFELVRRSDGARPQADLNGRERASAQKYDALVREGVARASELDALERKDQVGELTQAEAARRRELQAQAEVWRRQFQERLLAMQTELVAARGPSASAADLDRQSLRLQTLVSSEPGSVGLTYVVQDERLSIIVSTAQGNFVRTTALKREELNRQVAAFRAAVQSPARDARGPAQALYQSLIGPVVGDLEAADARTLVLSLTDVLRYVPFAALYDGKQWAVQRWAVSQVVLGADQRAEPSRVAWKVAGLGTTRAIDTFSALPGVEQELRGIVRTDGSTSGALPGTIALDESFDRARLERALREPVVHVGSHYVFRPGDESNSFLLMGDGSRLTLAAIGVLNFRNTELLTLSACDTASGGGTDERGAEVEGLATAVVRRGAQAVLATLWPVADPSTAQLMQRFYALRSDKEPIGRGQALRRAQLALLEGSGPQPGAPAQVTRAAEVQRAPGAASPLPPAPKDPARPFDHPFYWAPFVLMGNWR